LLQLNCNASNNYSYFPVVFESEDMLLRAKDALDKRDISPRRYFYPSLDTLAYLHPQAENKVSRDIASRVLCLPIYPGLKEFEVQTVIEVIKSCVPPKE
jgi:dTDP-4-amino-4,6-dideoxygalactose transaminase